MNSVTQKCIFFIALISTASLLQGSQIARATNLINHAYSANDPEIKALLQVWPDLTFDLAKIIASYSTYKLSWGKGAAGTIYSLAWLPENPSTDKTAQVIALGCGDGSIRFLDLQKDPLHPCVALSQPLTGGHKAPVSVMAALPPSDLHTAGLLLSLATVRQRRVTNNMAMDRQASQASVATSLNIKKEAQADERLLVWDLATETLQKEMEAKVALSRGVELCSYCPSFECEPCRLRGFKALSGVRFLSQDCGERDAPVSYTRTWNLDSGDHIEDQFKEDDGMKDQQESCSSELRRSRCWKLISWGSCCSAPICAVVASAATGSFAPATFLAGFAQIFTTSLPVWCGLQSCICAGASARESVLPDGQLYELALENGLTVSAYANGSLQIKDERDQEAVRVQTIPKAHTAPISALCPLWKTKLFASASSDGVVKIWYIPTGECLESFSRHAKGPIYSILPSLNTWKTCEGKKCTRCFFITGGQGGIEIFESKKLGLTESTIENSARDSDAVSTPSASSTPTSSTVTLAQAPAAFDERGIQNSHESPVSMSSTPSTPVSTLELAAAPLTPPELS